MSGGNPAGHGVARIGAQHPEAADATQVIGIYCYIYMNGTRLSPGMRAKMG